MSSDGTGDDGDDNHNDNRGMSRAVRVVLVIGIVVLVVAGCFGLAKLLMFLRRRRARNAQRANLPPLDQGVSVLNESAQEWYTDFFSADSEQDSTRARVHQDGQMLNGPVQQQRGSVASSRGAYLKSEDVMPGFSAPAGHTELDDPVRQQKREPVAPSRSAYLEYNEDVMPGFSAAPGRADLNAQVSDDGHIVALGQGGDILNDTRRRQQQRHRQGSGMMTMMPAEGAGSPVGPDIRNLGMYRPRHDVLKDLIRARMKAYGTRLEHQKIHSYANHVKDKTYTRDDIDRIFEQLQYQSQ